MQKAIIVVAYFDAHNRWTENGMDEVEELLEQGWKVVSCNPMGGAGAHEAIEFASVFILEKND